MSSRKAYSCEHLDHILFLLTPAPGTPCRTKKIKVDSVRPFPSPTSDFEIQCDRRKICGQCGRKSVQCIWPENGVPLEDEVEPPAALSLRYIPLSVSLDSCGCLIEFVADNLGFKYTSSPINTPYHPHTLPPPIRFGPSYHPLTSHIHPLYPSTSTFSCLRSRPQPYTFHHLHFHSHIRNPYKNPISPSSSPVPSCHARPTSGRRATHRRSCRTARSLDLEQP